VSCKFLAALTCAVPMVVAPAAADASLTSKYNKAYAKVVKLHGKRAPGRHIIKYGVRTKHGKVRPATNAEKAKSLRTLRMLVMPPPAARLVTTGPPPQPPAGTQTVHAGGTLAAIRQCESGGNYSTNTGNGFYGAYQFTQSTWESVGGSGSPAAASPAEQDKRAAILYAKSGPGPWPVCGR
jgi:hypothetical protein